ncbi:MAG: ABC transporter permease [Alphaproteobacteria bacterium]|nr:ABC transporter permease [Alphaproteobacteria bacterium]
MRWRLPPLHKKFLRHLWRMKWQALAIVLLVAAGVAVTVMTFSAEEALRSARATYYAQSSFADIFVTMERAPLTLARRAGMIPGVTAADPRIVANGLSLLPGFERPAQVRLISLPDRDDAALNRIAITRGRAPAPEALNEAVALQSFLDATKLRIGDDIQVTVNGRFVWFRIVGAALSAEYVYLPDAASVMPDDAHNGVLWVTRKALEGAADMHGAFNALAFSIAPGVQPRSIETRVERMFAPYGVQPVVMRADQPSHAFLEGELKELQTSGTIFPPVFLIVAAALVHMTLLRQTEVQREEIGLLKAFGYTDLEAARPFAMTAILIAGLGAALGALIGAVFAGSIVDIYARYMRFPALEPRFHVAAFAVAAGASLIAAVTGATAALGKVTRLSPATAMAPPRPDSYRVSWFERIVLGRSRGLLARLIARNVERRPARAALTVFGLAASVALLMGTQFLFGALDVVLDHTFYQRQRFSHQITFSLPRGPEAADDVRTLPGVMSFRLVRITSATLSNGARSVRTAITGLDPGDPLQRPLDATGELAPIKPQGVLLSKALAGKLGARPGDFVTVRLHERDRRVAAVVVAGIVTEYSGLGAYMDRRVLNTMIGEGDLSNAAQIVLDPLARGAFYRSLAETPGVVGAQSRDDVMATYRRVIAEAFRTSRTYYAVFAGIIAFGVAYNAGRIALSERSRDLATLEVLGFTHSEIAVIQLGEQAILAVVAVPIGLALGWLLAHGISLGYQRDEMQIPAIIDLDTLRMTLSVYGLTVAAVGCLIAYRLWRLDLVAVLKTRE